MPVRSGERSRALARAAVTLIALLPLGALAASLAPKVKSPHGPLDLACADCHDARGWKPARVDPKFDHAKSGSALEGAHRSTPCASCHVSLDFRGVRPQCASCHEDPHAGELGPDCARCHGNRSFLDRRPMVAMHELTALPLAGVHAALDCESCHPPAAPGRLRFVATSAECRSCHLADYRATTDPDHEAGGFPLECEACHSASGWNRARFDHARTGFPLTGAHRGAACAQCHAGGAYAGTSTDCYACHAQDYQSATDPDHAAAGFGTACATCHSTTGWSGASFDHDADFFPIHSGAHQGKWSACGDCHTNPARYSDFSCLGCHPHSDRAETDAHHREQSGYRYESPSCYACHPRGRS